MKSFAPPLGGPLAGNRRLLPAGIAGYVQPRFGRAADSFFDHSLGSNEEIVSGVCKYFCKGYPAAQIRSAIQQDYKVKLKREDPWRMLNRAGNEGWLRAVTPLDHELSQQLQDRYQWLKRADVVTSCVADDVSYRLANLIVELMRDFRQDHPEDSEIHVGFAGGSALKKSAAILAKLLREEWRELPQKIVFHAMVANFNLKDPTSDPNAFFTYLSADAGISVETEFVSLLAPGSVKSSMRRELLQIDEVDWAVRQAGEIDIFVTSAGGHGAEGHSALHDMYRRSPTLRSRCSGIAAAAAFLGTLSFTSSLPVAVVALRGFTNQRGEFLMSTLPVIDTAAAPSNEIQVLPQYADGGGWTTQILLINPTSAPLTGNVQFVNDGGIPSNVTITGQTSSSFAYAVAPRSSQKLVTSGTPAAVAAGSVRVIPTTGIPTPIPLALFSYRTAGITVSEVLPLSTVGRADVSV